MIWDAGDRGVFLCLTVRRCDACGQDSPHVQTDAAATPAARTPPTCRPTPPSDAWPAATAPRSRAMGERMVPESQYMDLVRRTSALDREHARLRTERDALQATADRLRLRLHAIHDLWREWQYGEYSATHVEPGIAYCADQLAKVIATSEETDAAAD